MSGSESLGRFLLIVGGTIFLLGLVLTLTGRVPWIGRLPGDIVIRRERFGCHVPLVTSILLSILLTLVVNVILRLLNR